MKIAFVYMNNECNVGRGAGYIAEAVVQAGHDLKFYDTFFNPVEKVAEDVVKGDFDVLMISTMTMLFKDAVRLIAEVKKCKKITVLMGGVHPTIIGGKLLEEYPEIDYLCIGEGESMVVEFLENLGKDSLYDIQNLAYRRDGKVFANPLRPAEDLAKCPPFPWHYFPEKAIVQEGQGFLYVNATRGCPYNCTYCLNGIYLKHYGKNYLRFRPIDDVVAELAFLKQKYNPLLFYFGDEMILSNIEYAYELFRTIKKELNVPYGCMGRVEYITPEAAKILSETGCQYMGMGLECGDEDFRRKHLNRKMTNQQIEDAFKLLKEAGIFVTSFNMIGYPFDEDDQLTQRTLELNQKIKPDYVQISIFYPFPGTKLYERCIENDLVDRDKLTNAKDYFAESVLKGKSLAAKKNELNAILNPNGFKFTVKDVEDRQVKVKPKNGKKILMAALDHIIIDRRILQQAETLVREGYEVTVISGFECPEEEHYVSNGVHIHRYKYMWDGPKPPAVVRGINKISLLKRAVKWVLGGRKRLFFLDAFSRFVVDKAAGFQADVVHIHDLPLLWLGVILSSKWNAKLVFDSHEIYCVNETLPKEIRIDLEREERAFARKTDIFITVNDMIADYFKNLYGKRPLVLMNCADTPHKAFSWNAKRNLRKKVGLSLTDRVVLYQGWFSHERNLLSLIKSVEYFPEDAYLVMIGYGDFEKDMRAELAGKPWENKVKFYGKVKPSEMLSVTAGADLGIIPYQAVDLNHKFCSPNKFFEFVQAGVPIVAQDLAFFRMMAEKYGVVLPADISTAEGMGKAANSLLNDKSRLEKMAAACKDAARELNWEVEGAKLVAEYEKMFANK